MLRKPPKRKRTQARGRGRPPAFTDLQRKQIRKIAREEMEAAFRDMLGTLGIRYGRRKR